MGRPKDEYYWNQVHREEDGKLKCKHCGFKFKGGVSRIKAHIDRLEGKGIRICSTSPKDITSSDHSHQDIPVITVSQVVENGLEMDGGASTSLSALFEGYDNGVLTTLQSKLDELRSDLTREEEDIQGQLQLLESDGKKRKRKVDCWLNDIQNMKQRAIDMKNSLNQFWCSNFDVPQGERYLAEESQKEIKLLTEKFQEHKKRKPIVLYNEFFGSEFERYVKTMWKLMLDDRIFIIGIYGMGGVGKTFLAAYMYDEIKRNKTFKDVLWVTVAHDFTIFKLQECIAKIIKVTLYKDDERERAMILTSELKKRGNIVLILDDVWKYIDVEKVGIPIRVNGIKLIMTSRLRHVCQQMDCLAINLIKVSPFFNYDNYDDYDDSDGMDYFDGYHGYEYEDYVDDHLDDDSRKLFLLKLGLYKTPLTFPPGVWNIARFIVKTCDGLPLGINVMARTMKGITNIHWWRYMQNKFLKLEKGVEMQEEVLNVLKRSYDNLNEKDVQKCFLYIALLPNDMFRDYLIVELVNIGLLKGNRSLEEIFDEGNVILDKLVNHSLLIESPPDNHSLLIESPLDKLVNHSLLIESPREDDLKISMHGLVKKMALNIMKESDTNMIKCDGNMKKIPDIEEWTIDLKVVSLAKNKIKKIPEGTSPNCPCLSTLLLFESWIEHIPECFFTHMNALTTLDLSKNSHLTHLPHSLSNLRSLTSLILDQCWQLKDIPPLGQLQSLLRLQISGCSIEVIPKGLEILINLKWLDLSNNVNLKLVSGTFLSRLTNLQYLNLYHCLGGIKAEDLEGMSMLECFAGTFVDYDSLNRYVREILNSINGPQTYLIHYGDGDLRPMIWNHDHMIWNHDRMIWDHDHMIWNHDRMIWDHESRSSLFKCRIMLFRDCKEGSLIVPSNLRRLLLHCNDYWVCLCDALSSNNGFSLEQICIHSWTKLTSLFCSFCSLCMDILNLQSLKLYNLESLTTIYQELSPRDMFSDLKTLDVKECHQIKILLPSRLVRHLQNLEWVFVRKCNSMEQIFGLTYEDNDENDEDDEDDEDDKGEHEYSNKIRLPKLIYMYLEDLVQLKIVCKEILICKSEFKPVIFKCPKLCEPTIEFVTS